MNGGKGGNSKTYRQLNRGLMLKLIATGVCTSRAELARRTGLTKMAVTNIVSEMLEQHLIEETSAVQNEEVGRNPIRLKISGKCPKIIGVLIFRSRLEVVLCDFSLKILRRETRVMKEACVTNSQGLMDQLYEMVDRLKKKERNILGIGVASIGPVDVKNGMILEPLYFWDIKNIPIVELLTERYQLPVFLNHDNQSGALAELLYGYGNEYKDFLFLGLGRGIGCGMVMNGSLYENQSGLPSEIGHTSIDYQGEQCTCGNKGCLELYATTPVVEERLQRETQKDYRFTQFCRAGSDPAAEEVFADVMKKLAAALVNYVNILNPGLILLGHDGIYLPENAIAVLKKEVNSRRFFHNAAEIDIKKTQFGADAQLLGGACQVLQQAFLGKMLF